MTKISFAACRRAVLAAAVASIVACGGGSGSVASCDAVISGFQGSLVDDYPNGDGGWGGGDGDGGAGGGAGLGKVLGGTVRVVSLADRRVIGETTTDTTSGLFTVRTCRSPEPLLITLRGQAGAKYYDEGKNALVPFGEEQELHVLVDRLDENIGVSAFTEAAYRYAINHLPVNDPSLVVGNPGAVHKTVPESSLRLSAEQIRTINQVVLDEVNRLLPQSYRMDSLKSLPVPIDGADIGVDSISTLNRYGQATIVTGAFAWMADRYHLGTEHPALDAVEIFARDMTDGSLNGFALDGTPASAVTGPAYSPVTMPIDLTVGANTIAELFSRVYLESAPKYVDFNTFRYGDTQCPTLEDRYALLRTGAVSVRRLVCGTDGRPSGDPALAIDNFGAHEDTSVKIKQIYSTQWTGGGTLVYSNGDVRAWGNNNCGQLGDGKTDGLEMQPVPVIGMHNITSMASGYNFSIARDERGNAYAWGEEGVLGLGESNQRTCTHATPTRVPSLADIVSVHAAGSRAFAIDRSGHLYAWGGDCGGEPGRSLSPVRRDDLGSVVSMAANEHGCFALKPDGTLVGWGFGRGTWIDGKTYDWVKYFGDGQDVPRLSPTPLAGLTDIREVASDNYAFYALDSRGRVWRWGGVEGQPSFATTPTVVSQLGGVFRHISSNIEGAHLFAADGKVYQLFHGGEDVWFRGTADLGFE